MEDSLNVIAVTGMLANILFFILSTYYIWLALTIGLYFGFGAFSDYYENKKRQKWRKRSS